ncbi:hypothetical protein [Nocardia acidivorans]|uniref:hypothetical protein n=1 Tax=Nocardia acidivorans TaxID=404580 RepID=UPI000836988C|nr:hypothetical protein [Nocardia acidivorans]
MLLLIAGALVLLPLVLLAGIALTGSHHGPASPVAPVRVSNTEPATTTPVKPCYPFQLDCTPG